MMRNDTFAKEKDPIQRWFFRPNNQTAKQALIDHAKGVFRPIDDFASGKASPKSVRMKEDPYFKVFETIKKQDAQKKSSKKKKKQKTLPAATGPTTIKLT